MLWYFYGSLQVVVYEKEHRLRTIMRMMGLTSNGYWLTTYFLEVLKYVIILSLVYIFGAAVGLKYFLKQKNFGPDIMYIQAADFQNIKII